MLHRGFRARLGEAAASHAGTALFALALDLPTITLISGYAIMRGMAEAGAPPGNIIPAPVLQRVADVCSGWRADGTMVARVSAAEGGPTVDCPPAPDLARPDDPAAWHEMPVLAPHQMRRRRRMDVTRVGDEFVLDATFRDSYADREGTEVVLHEYTVAGWLDADLRLTEIVARPHVLPYGECPLAAPRVAALVGTRAPDIRDAVKRELAGIAGCTHLNDLLNHLTDVPELVAHL